MNKWTRRAVIATGGLVGGGLALGVAGIAFAPNNRDVTIFPEKIGGRYVALHRPMPEGIGQPAIWIASSR